MATSKRTRRSGGTTVRKAKGAATSEAKAPVELEDDDDEALLPAAVQDPLAVEPLSTAEIRGLEAHHAGVSEQREAMLEVLRKGTEAKLPFDPDEAESLIESADQRLEVHLRPKHKR
ncbi:MAG: hypothetical protein IT383_05865 [Deltaproteobacteria bacterium]|nr:hypothetical protein [Deltaproteobacteria bacterium]